MPVFMRPPRCPSRRRRRALKPPRDLEQKVYGRLDCPVALSLIRRGRAKVDYRVFFADAETARACGYRSCGACLREEYRVWKAAAAAE
jgi:hypothetical protein